MIFGYGMMGANYCSVPNYLPKVQALNPDPEPKQLNIPVQREITVRQ
jgi:hypothetical protein